MATDWNMPPRGKVCCACDREFAPGERFDAVLLNGDAGYERRDYCTGCRPDENPAVLGAWQTCRPAPAAKPAPTFDRQRIFEFFCRLDGDDASRAELRFVLALLLWRKKVLRFAQTLEATERETWRFARVGADETFDVVRPDLDEERVEQLSAQLEQLVVDEGAGAPGDAPENARA